MHSSYCYDFIDQLLLLMYLMFEFFVLLHIQYVFGFLLFCLCSFSVVCSFSHIVKSPI